MRNIYRIAMTLAVLVFTAASCTDTLEVNKGEIRFSAGTQQAPGTKTSYSGTLVDGRERVDWTAGDVMTIYCEESPTPASHQSDYKIVGTPSSSGYYSVGSVERRVGDIGLRWADDETLVHHFYAVSPANYTNHSVSVRYYVDTQRAEYIGSVPATQAPKSVSADANGNYTAAPDMLNLIMVAQVAQTKNESETVTLDFKPVVTTVDFTIMNGYADQSAMTLSNIRLSSSTADLAGGFSAFYDDTESTEYASAGRTVEIPFSSPASVAYGKTLKFTVFLLGDESTTAADIDNLTIELITDDDTSIQSVLKTTAGNMTFPRSKKSYVTGLIVPGACVWTISAEPDAVTAWNESSSSIDIGPAQELPVSGPFGGLYLSKGYLEETAADTYKLTGNDQLEIIKYYGEDLSSTPYHYHSWTEEMAMAVVDGFSVPTADQMATIVGTTRTGAIVNETSGKHYAMVSVDLTGSEYESYALSGSNTIYGMLLFPDGAEITCADLTVMDSSDDAFSNSITYAQLLSLCTGNNGCAILPCAGHVQDVEWETGGNMGWYFSSTIGGSSPLVGNAMIFTPGIMTPYYRAYGSYCPVRLVKE